MKYQVLENFKVKTSRGELELEAGQIITIAHDKAIKLLNKGKIIPIEKVAYKIYSELLEAYLWVVDTPEVMEYLRASKNIAEAIYTREEITKLKNLPQDTLKGIHEIKEVFDRAIIEGVNRI